MNLGMGFGIFEMNLGMSFKMNFGMSFWDEFYRVKEMLFISTKQQ